MTAEPPPLDIGLSLRGERIFITGSTGFLGKVLVEKLLWSVPEVGRLLLLIRPSDARSAAQRLREEVLASPIMARLRALHFEDWESWAAGKIEVVSGDLARDRFGLAEEEYTRIAADVDRVVACAATVTFDERLDRALELNARGALRTLALARDARPENGVPLLHVSTCFVSGQRKGSVAERVAVGEVAELDPTLAALDEACRRASRQEDAGTSLVAAGAALAARYGFHDAYTLTKALGERLLVRERGSVPVAILRPAIVESAAAEPIPGWIDAVRVADPMLVAYGRGLSRDFPGAPEARLDLVPVDTVVNAMIAALAELGTDSQEIRVYQVASGRNPVTLGELVSRAREGFARTPLRDEGDEPIAPGAPRFVEPERYRRRLLARRRRAERISRWLGSTGWGRRQAAGARMLGHFDHLFEVYQPYMDHDVHYEDRAIQALWGRLSAVDREAFPFDIGALDWPSYIANVHVPGIIRFALRAQGGAPPPPPLDDPVAEAHARGEFPAAAASTLFELLALAAVADSEALVLQICRQGRWLRYTYGQALTATTNIAMRLARSYGIERCDRVVLWGSASPEWVLTSFAVHRLGAVTVPLDPQWPVEEIAQAARFTGAKLICAAPTLRAKLAATGAATLGEEPLPVVELAAPFVPEPEVGLLPGAEQDLAVAEADDLATILFTSGTTVAPKAVPLTHANLLSNVRALVPVMRSSRQRLLSVLPIHHVFEFMVGLLVPLVGGGTISYVAEIKPAEISWMMGVTRPTMLVAVPRLLELLHNGIQSSVAAGGPWLGRLFRLLFALSRITGGRHGHRLFGKVHQRFGGSLRRIATGGSALEASLGRSFQLMGFEVAEGYGMTETSPVLTVNPWGAIRFGSVGRPLAGVEIELRPIVDTTQGAEPGSGEIWVRGGNVMAGYYGNPEASVAAMDDGWLNTGDVGFFDDDGYLHIAGRTKDVIVTSAGKNVYPEEVEQRYRGFGDEEELAVEELVVLGLSDGGRGERVTAVVVPRADATPEEIERIRTAITARSQKVPSYQRIARIEIWRGDLPKTTTLKVKRGLLRDAILAGEHGASTTAPATVPPPAAKSAPSEDESWLLTTLARLTRSRSDQLEESDSLAELGVDSLTKVELVAEIEGHFGLRLNDESVSGLVRVRDLFDLVGDGRETSSG